MTCTRCGKPLAITGDAPYVRCVPCGSAYVVLGDEAFPYTRLAPRVPLSEAGRRFHRWMEDNLGSAGLQGVATMGEPRAYDLPFWVFTRPDLGFTSNVLVPAMQTALPELRRIEMRASDIGGAAIPTEVEENVAPTVPREVAWAEAGGTGPLVEGNGWLVRLPLYEFPYTYNGRGFRVIVDGVTGECRVQRYPQRSQAGLVLMLMACLVAFAFEGWVLWGHGGWLAAAYIITAIPAGVVTWYILRSARNQGP